MPGLWLATNRNYDRTSPPPMTNRTSNQILACRFHQCVSKALEEIPAADSGGQISKRVHRKASIVTDTLAAIATTSLSLPTGISMRRIPFLARCRRPPVGFGAAAGERAVAFPTD